MGARDHPDKLNREPRAGIGPRDGLRPPGPAPGPTSELRREKDVARPSTEPRREAVPRPVGPASSMLGRPPRGFTGMSFGPASLAVSSSWRPLGRGLPAMDLQAGELELRVAVTGGLSPPPSLWQRWQGLLSFPLLNCVFRASGTHRAGLRSFLGLSVLMASRDMSQGRYTADSEPEPAPATSSHTVPWTLWRPVEEGEMELASD